MNNEMSYIDEDDVYQEGLISWWRDRKERKKNALNDSISNIADEMESMLHVKFSPEYRKYFMEGPLETKSKILSKCDVLVDGPFIFEKRDLKLPFKGSSNQRVIDLKHSTPNNVSILL